MLSELDANGWAAIGAMVTALCGMVVTVVGMILSHLRGVETKTQVEGVKKDVAEVHRVTNSLSDKRAEAATEAGVMTGKLLERDRADLESKNIAVGAAGGVGIAGIALPVPPLAAVDGNPIAVQIVNPPTDPVPVVDAKKKV